MTNFRRRQAEAADDATKAPSLAATRARAILTNEDAPVRDAVIAGGLLRMQIKEAIG